MHTNIVYKNVVEIKRALTLKKIDNLKYNYIINQFYE